MKWWRMEHGDGEGMLVTAEDKKSIAGASLGPTERRENHRLPPVGGKSLLTNKRRHSRSLYLLSVGPKLAASYGFFVLSSHENAFLHRHVPSLHHFISFALSIFSHYTRLCWNHVQPMSPPARYPHSAVEDLSLNSIAAVIAAVDRHFHQFLSSPATRRSLQLRCAAKIANPTCEFFEFSDQSVLSNLYWGIEAVESAINAESPSERNARLADSEKMLQIPAMLDEDATTAGIDNRYIICCSYFHLALIRKLRGDDWQMAMHFLQAVLVLPSCVRSELAPELWANLFGSPAIAGGGEEAARRWARRYKDMLMYYQVVSYSESRNNQYETFSSIRYPSSVQKESASTIVQDINKADPLCSSYSKDIKKEMAPISKSVRHQPFIKLNGESALCSCLDEGFETCIKDTLDIRCLQEMLEESQSNSPASLHSDSPEASDLEERIMNKVSPGNGISANEGPMTSDMIDRNRFCKVSPMSTVICESKGYKSGTCPKDSKANSSQLVVKGTSSSLNNLSFSTLDFRHEHSNLSSNHQREDENLQRTSPRLHGRCFSSFSSKFQKKCSLFELVPRGNWKKKNLARSDDEWTEESPDYEKELQRFEKVVSALLTLKGSEYGKSADWKINTMWELLHNETQLKYSSTKQETIEQLLKIISCSKKEKEIRVSVTVLLVLIFEDETIIEDIKRKNIQLYDLAKALKRNVHEAAILIYLLNPSPLEIRNLELLPALVEVACTSKRQKDGMISLPLTPTLASIAMIEMLVTAFDYVTNNMHLAAITSPKVLSELVNVAMSNNVSEGVALTSILIKCMRLNEKCRKFLSQVSPVYPFIHLLRIDKMSAKSAALEYFYELLFMPRSSAIRLLQQIRQQGGARIMEILLVCVMQSKNENQLYAGNLLLQLDMLEGTKGRDVFKEKAIMALLESVATEDNLSMQSLSAFILANLGGTFSWTGKSYTAAWLVKKAGLKATYYRDMVKGIDWHDPCLQDSEIFAWSRKTAKYVIKFGEFVFSALAKGIRSQSWSIKRSCLITSAWLGSEMAVVTSSNLQYTACEILLDEVSAFLHPGTELDERVLACLCVYNYTSGRGKEKLLTFSEGLRESLRRLSGVTWMAEELLNVTDYVLPNKPRVSCVHTQTLEIVNSGDGAVTALIFYKGLLCTGYWNGTIKVWDIRGKHSLLLWEVKKHKKLVSCFAISESSDGLLSGSTDRTVRDWKRHKGPLISVKMSKGKSVQAMDVVEDFIYVNCSSSSSTIQIYLREKQQSVGRLSAGSKITSLLAANDMILCGTEAGLVKVFI
ncbi:Putative E3 ubiquitin-protein ligase LIN-1 [Apostasia shenzhenica]|uniref:E3 ubiquitin-protein ligase LIN-1 n=1 Tax=Apostasia shenzhenica TaxID=1088818 RepID=A0A2I0AQ73_9ASPA|nr:Putative E3 ubiquitin-protein ligase LIN-1 [Apostasia shenzhenica]